MTDIPASLRDSLAGQYALERELGEGGMATVYLAEDVKHHRKVAVKVLRPDVSATLGADRFLREIQIAARLQHPHILPLYDSGQANGFLYYVMPYIEGESLRARLTRERELPVAEAVRILRDLVDALAHAHAHGIVHRDIKPENILISGRHALVADFGVAKAVSEATGRQKLTTAGVALGTPVYMAPEQAVADPHVDHRADIYAVGVVAYELLAGRPPFAGLSPQAILAAHVTETPEPVTKHRAQVPEQLTQLVMRCLEKKAADRPQKADELLATLETVMTPTAGTTPTHTQPLATATARWRPRRWQLVTAATVAVAVLSMGAWAVATRAAADPNRRLIVVAPFENRTGDSTLDELGELAANWLADAISRDGAAEAVPATTVRELVRTRLARSTERGTDLARLTGARIAIVGAFTRRGDSVELSGTLVDGRTGRSLSPIDAVRGSAANADVLAQLELRALEVVRDYFEVQVGDLRAFSRPTSIEAYRENVRGGEYFSRGQYRDAVVSLGRAVALDTAWVWPQIGLASAYYNLLDRERADSILRALAPRRARFSPGDQDAYDWLTAWLSGDKIEEYRTARRLFDRAPRAQAYAMAVTALRTNRPSEVVEAARFRDTTTAWGREWFSWYSVQASAQHLLGRYRDELRIALERRARDPLAQNALDLEITARAAMGQADEVTQLLDQSTSKPSGWDSGPGRAYAEFLAHGHDEAARAILPRAVRTFETAATQTGATRSDSQAFARALLWSRDYRRALDWYQRLVARNPSDWTARRSVVLALAGLGQREEALRASDAWPSSPQPYCAGCESYYRAWVAALLGNRSRAVELLQQALSEGYAFGAAVHRSWALLGMRDDVGVRALLRPKD